MRCIICLLLLSTLLIPVSATRLCAFPAAGDSLYDAHHPRLLFAPADIPALKSKITDGGVDDAAYAYLRNIADNAFPLWTEYNLLYGDFGFTTMPVLGVATWLAMPEDTASRARGRDLTLYIADNYAVDNEETGSALRLCALSYGYDMFFHNEPDSLRAIVVAEIVGYLQAMSTVPYHVWERRPYLANHSAMVAGALGLGAICLDGEVDPVLLGNAMDYADAIIDSLLLYQLDPGGSYKEGGLYIGWTMRHLVYYFAARKRFDGFNYGDNPRVREVENWVPYEMLPEGGARLNNMNDCSISTPPLSFHNTFFAYGQSEWNSAMCAWIWDRVSGTYGVDAGLQSDKVATVLWHRNLTPQDPNDVLPKSKIWVDRGLYHYRTGWQTGASSDDVMFTFFSGKFHGGHAQEDQNQFTLYGYGSRFAIDHGPGGSKGKQSQAHNIVLVDGKGEHNAGGSIGIDGEISAYLQNGFVDYVQGDATRAYTTHSPFNNAGYPFPASDWSWGYDGGNPVEKAIRNILAVRGSSLPPYFIIMDDIEKDGAVHLYEWQLHTLVTNSIDVSTSPVRIVDGSSWMNVYSAGHAFGDLTITTSLYDNLTSEPDATRLCFAINADDPYFAFILVPGDVTVVEPVVDTTHETWGSWTTLAWGVDDTDIYIFNRTRSNVTIALPRAAQPERRRPFDAPAMGFGGDAGVSTDAACALLRFYGGVVQEWIAVEATHLAVGRTPVASISNGPATFARSATTIDIDRDDAAFAFYGPGVTDIRYRDQALSFQESNDILTPSPEPPPASRSDRPVVIRVEPNPFNPATRVTVVLSTRARTRVSVYDVAGRRVATLWDGTLGPGPHDFNWDGNRTTGKPAASGVYFVRVDAGAFSRTVKATLLK